MDDRPASKVAAGDGGAVGVGEDDRLLEAWLAGHDASCPRCGYGLRGLTRGRCPECDARLELGVRSPEAVMRWFVLGLVGLSMALGFDGVVFAAVVMMTVIWGPNAPWAIFAWFGGGSAGMALAVWGWVRLRARLQSQSEARQFIIVLGLWAGTFLVHFAVFGHYMGWW